MESMASITEKYSKILELQNDRSHEGRSCPIELVCLLSNKFDIK
jgi:hypothetical protein